MTRRRSAGQNARDRCCRRRRFISPSSLAEGGASSAGRRGSRKRKSTLGRAGSWVPPVQGSEAYNVVSPGGRAEGRDAEQEVGPQRGEAAHAVVTAAKRRIPGRSRQEQRGRAPSPGPKPPGPGAAAMAAAEGGKRAEEGGREGREERGRGADQPAPQQPRASTAAPPAARRKACRLQERETRGLQEGLTVPSSVEQGERRRGGLQVV